MMNGVSATGGQKFVIPSLIEGPIAGCFFGGANALIAWHLFLKCMNVIGRRSEQWQVKFFLLASLAISVCEFVGCAAIATSGSAPLLLQVVARFTAVLSLALSCTITFCSEASPGRAILGVAVIGPALPRYGVLEFAVWRASRRHSAARIPEVVVSLQTTRSHSWE
jgi:hypothetical protein